MCAARVREDPQGSSAACRPRVSLSIDLSLSSVYRRLLGGMGPAQDGLHLKTLRYRIDGVKRKRAVTSNVPPLALKLNSKVPRGLLRLVNLTRIVQSTYANRETQTEMPCHADAQSCSSLAIIRLTYLLPSHTHGTHTLTHTRHTHQHTHGHGSPQAARWAARWAAHSRGVQPSLKP